MNTVSYFEIQSDNPEKAISFYETVFDWEFIKEEKMPVDYWRIQQAGPNGGLLGRPVPIPQGPSGTNAFVCSVMVDNFDETAQKILDNGGQIALEKFAVPGKCWQGYFLDLDHNTFGIFEVDENAK